MLEDIRGDRNGGIVWDGVLDVLEAADGVGGNLEDVVEAVMIVPRVYQEYCSTVFRIVSAGTCWVWCL